MTIASPASVLREPAVDPVAPPIPRIEGPLVHKVRIRRRPGWPHYDVPMEEATTPIVNDCGTRCHTPRPCADSSIGSSPESGSLIRSPFLHIRPLSLSARPPSSDRSDCDSAGTGPQPKSTRESSPAQGSRLRSDPLMTRARNGKGEACLAPAAHAKPCGSLKRAAFGDGGPDCSRILEGCQGEEPSPSSSSLRLPHKLSTPRRGLPWNPHGRRRGTRRENRRQYSFWLAVRVWFVVTPSGVTFAGTSMPSRAHYKQLRSPRQETAYRVRENPLGLEGGRGYNRQCCGRAVRHFHSGPEGLRQWIVQKTRIAEQERLFSPGRL